MWAVLFVVGIERYQVQGTGMMLRVNRFLFLPEHRDVEGESFSFFARTLVVCARKLSVSSLTLQRNTPSRPPGAPRIKQYQGPGDIGKP